MSKENLLTIFKEKTVDRIYDIHSKLANASFPVIAAAFGFFGDGFSEKKILQLYSRIPTLLDDKSHENLKTMITSIKGFSDKTANKIISHLDNAKVCWCNIQKIIVKDGLHPQGIHSKIENHPQSINIDLHASNRNSVVIIEDSKGEAEVSDIYLEDSKSEAVESKCDYCTGKMFVFSGFRNAELERYIQNNGGSIISGVSSKTSHLIVKDMNDTKTVKVRRAIDFNIPISTYEEFVDRYIPENWMRH
jgi:NAD-dependent DNA ligase